VNRSIWNGITNEPKTTRSKAAVPVIKELAEALEELRKIQGQFAVGPIFQGGNGKPLNLDNLARRMIIPTSKNAWYAVTLNLNTNPKDIYLR
jgi:hypothetical protein